MNNLDDEEYVRARLGNVWWRLNNLYMIENEDGELVVFKMRPAQILLFQMMRHKNIVLKARQLGFSTAIDIWLLDQALFNDNLKCGIIAQDKQAAGEIFRTKIEIPFDNLPQWLKSAFKVAERRSGASGGYIRFGHGSTIQVATSFRSGTVQRLHISELGKICAKYPAKAREIRTGTLNSVHENAIVFIESTAEGVGGDYYTMCNRAIELELSSIELTRQDYKMHFFAWYQDPKYSLAIPASGLIFPKHLIDYFDAVEKANDIKLSQEQRHWYMKKEIEQGDEMKQEFPSTPEEAFLTSGRKVFDATKLILAKQYVIDPLLVYDIEPITGNLNKISTSMSAAYESEDIIQRTVLNMLLVWELPDEDEEYAIGVDIAEGLEHGDRSSIDVVKQSTGEQVAHWFGYIDVELLAHITKWIALMYNKAYVGPERNNHGHAFLLELKKIYPISRIYQEQYLDRDNDDETAKFGWLTTKHSKPVLTEGFKSLLRENESGIRWIGTHSEMTTFVYDKKGSMGAQDGCYDDQVMSYLIAQEMRARMPAQIKTDAMQRDENVNWMVGNA